MFRIVRHLCDSDLTPEEISDAADHRPNHLFRCVTGKVSSADFIRNMADVENQTGRKFDKRRYFCSDHELILSNGSTYALWNQWGKSTFEVIQRITKAFSEQKISCSPSGHTDE